MPPKAPNQNETRNEKRGKPSPLVDGLVRAERLFQIALILPLSVVVGWAIGAGLDKWLHQQWIYLVGVVLGCVAGFIEVFRVVQKNEESSEKDE